MGKFIDMTGERFGSLEVIERVYLKDKTNQVYWLCQCDCGETKIVGGIELRKRIVKHCNNQIHRVNDLTGQRFGKLTVMYLTKSVSSRGIPTWHCKCDCGNEKDVLASNLKNGHVSSCGCYCKEIRQQNLIGKKFGELEVLALSDVWVKNVGTLWRCKCSCGNEVLLPTFALNAGQKTCGCSREPGIVGERHGRLTAISPTNRVMGTTIVWKWRCDCGNIVETGLHQVRSGNTNSCGCYHKEKVSKIASKDLSGQVFGNLKPIKIVKKQNNMNVWECLCECGSITYATTNALTMGKVRSCGCVKSFGEKKIIELLINKGIYYEKEYKIDSCRFPNSNRMASFDFGIVDQNNILLYIIEYDGSQHFYASGYNWNTEDQLRYTQEHDKIKTNYCVEHNIPLIRIPYTRYDNLCIEDLLLETTQFRVV